MNDFVISCIYEYLDRSAIQTEDELKILHERIDLRKADTVDIIDLIELRQKYHTICQVQHDIAQILAWGRHLDLFT